MNKESKDEILPIDQQKVKGKIKHIFVVLPALNERWLCDKKFAYYVVPPRKLSDGSYVAGTKDTWISSMSQVLDDIWWICELPYHKFWSQIIYDPNTLNGVHSFLHLVPLQTLYYKTDDEDIISIYKRITKAVFQFLKRISRSKESELHFMSETKYREIMTGTNLMPISRLFCVCTIYGKEYEEQTRNIVENTFQYNTNLKLDHVVQRSIQLFGYLKKRLKSALGDLKRNVYYSKDKDDIRAASDSYRKCLVASCQYLANIFVNISSFLSIYQEGCEMFLNHDFDFHVIRVYKKLLIPLYKEVEIFFNDSCHILTYSWLISMLDLTRSELIKTFSVFLHSMVGLLSNPRRVRDVIQHYVKLLKLTLKINEFLQDLNSYCNLTEIMDKLKKQCVGNVDLGEIIQISQSIVDLLNKIENTEQSVSELRPSENYSITLDNTLEYVKKSYDSEDDEISTESDIDFSDDDLSSNYSDWSRKRGSDSEYECYLADSDDEKPSIKSKNDRETTTTAQIVGTNSIYDIPSTSTQDMDSAMSRAQLESAIFHIKDILPHLGDGFITICLQEYKMDATAVINAIFEDTLPAKLRKIDFTMPAVPHHTWEEPVENKQDRVPRNSLKEFKRVEYSSYKEMWNDKENISDAMKVYEQYRNVEEDELYNDDVEDDFDFGIAAQEVDTEVIYDKFNNIPSHNHRYQPEEEIEFDDYDDESSSKVDLTSKTCENGGIKPLDFCENPEIVRARREHQREVKEQKRYRKSAKNSGYQTKAFDQNKNDKPTNNRDFRNRLENKGRERNDDLKYDETNSTREPSSRAGNVVSKEESNREFTREPSSAGNVVSKEESNREVKNNIRKWLQTNDNRKSTEKESVSVKSSRGDDVAEKNVAFRTMSFRNSRYEESRKSTNTSRAENARGCNDDAGSKNDRFRRPPKTKNKFGECGADTNRRHENGSEAYQNERVGNDDPNDNHRPNVNCDNTARQRHYKTVNKSSKANHNRKYLSDRKRTF